MVQRVETFTERVGTSAERVGIGFGRVGWGSERQILGWCKCMSDCMVFKPPRLLSSKESTPPREGNFVAHRA